MRNGKADVHTDPGKPLLHASIRAGTTNDAAQLTALYGGCVRCRQRRSEELCKRSQSKAHSRCHVGPGPLTHLLHRRGHAAGRNRAEVRAHERLECIERQRTYNLQCVRCMRGRGLGCAQLVDAERRMNAEFTDREQCAGATAMGRCAVCRLYGECGSSATARLTLLTHSCAHVRCAVERVVVVEQRRVCAVFDERLHSAVNTGRLAQRAAQAHLVAHAGQWSSAK